MNTKNTVTCIGIDVSIKELEIHCYDSALKLPPAIANTKTGIGNIISKLKKSRGQAEKCIICLLALPLFPLVISPHAPASQSRI